MSQQVSGMLDSEISVKKYDRVELKVRDHTGAAIVSYYPIDSPFPAGVARGNWLRFTHFLGLDIGVFTLN